MISSSYLMVALLMCLGTLYLSDAFAVYPKASGPSFTKSMLTPPRGVKSDIALAPSTTRLNSVESSEGAEVDGNEVSNDSSVEISEELEEEQLEVENKPEENPELIALKEEIAALESTLRSKRLEAGKIEDEADEFTKSGYYRKCAEMDNFRKRRDLAFQNSKFVARATVMKKFLPIMDELKALGEQYQNDDFAKGYDALRKDFDLVIKNKLNLEEYGVAVGHPVNRFREAIVGYEHSDDVPDGSVLRQVSPGLEVKGNVVRFAECIVSKGKMAQDNEDASKPVDKGNILSSDGHKLGLKFGKLAIALGKNVPTDFQGIIPGIYNAFYGNILPWFESIQNALEPLVEAYVMARECGNIPATRVSCIYYFMLAFVAGESIEKLLKDVENLNDNTSKSPPVVAAVHQVLMNLHFNDNTTLSGDQFNFEAFDDFGVFMEKPYIYLLATINAYVMGKLCLALKYVEACTKHWLSSPNRTICNPIHSFYAGLSSIAIAKRRKQDSVVPLVRKIVMKLRNISKYSPKNFLNKVYLLEAEIAAVTGDTKQAEENYKLSISLSQEHMLKNEEAIAFERAGLFFLDINEPDSGLKYLSKALECYNEWGAIAKVKQLISQYPSLVAESNKSMSNLVGVIEEFHLVKSSQNGLSSTSNVSRRSSLKSNGNKSGGAKKRIRFSTLS